MVVGLQEVASCAASSIVRQMQHSGMIGIPCSCACGAAAFHGPPAALVRQAEQH